MLKRNSRWTDDPVLDGHGCPIVARITERDIEIFKLLNRYRYLRSNFIHAFIGGNQTALVRHLDLLQRKPNRWLLRPEKQRLQPNANYRHLIYELAPRAMELLKDRGLHTSEPRLGDEKLFAHSMMVNDTIASLELGGATLVRWPEIAARLEKPQRWIPVQIVHQFNFELRQHAFDYENDSHGPFGIRYNGGLYRFFSLEAEHTNPIECSNLRKTSFLKKFLAIQHIMENRLYQKSWGIPNLLTLVVAPNQSQIDAMTGVILNVTNGKGAPYVLFRAIPVLDDPRQTARPMPELYTGAWQRAGYPDLYLNRPTGSAC